MAEKIDGEQYLVRKLQSRERLDVNDVAAATASFIIIHSTAVRPSSFEATGFLIATN